MFLCFYFLPHLPHLPIFTNFTDFYQNLWDLPIFTTFTDFYHHEIQILQSTVIRMIFVKEKHL